MIPDHLIDKAWRAYVRSSNQQAIRNELSHPDLRGPMPPPPDPRQSLRAALETVAAHIWDEGFTRGVDADSADADLHETREIDLNPYRGATNG